MVTPEGYLNRHLALCLSKCRQQKLVGVTALEPTPPIVAYGSRNRVFFFSKEISSEVLEINRNVRARFSRDYDVPPHSPRLDYSGRPEASRKMGNIGSHKD